MPRLESLSQMKKALGEVGDVAPAPDVPRPRTRADCRDGPRPCGWVSCRHHLYADIQRSGHLLINSSVEPDQMEDSCALDVAERGGMTLVQIARILGVTKERVRQIVDTAMDTMATRVDRDGGLLPPSPDAPGTDEAAEGGDADLRMAADALGMGEHAEWLDRICSEAEASAG